MLITLYKHARAGEIFILSRVFTKVPSLSIANNLRGVARILLSAYLTTSLRN